MSVEKSCNEKVNILTREKEEVTSRCERLEQQNKILHFQVENLTKQLKQQLGSLSGGEIVTGPDSSAEMYTLIQYLRRENEISDEKLMATRQQVSRLESENLLLKKGMDQAKQDYHTLLVEKEEQVISSTEQNKSVALLEHMMLLRESNALLRDESVKQTVKNKELTAKVLSLSESLDPLKKQEHVVQGQVETLKTQIEELTESNNRWKDRVSQLTDKYNQADQEEYTRLKKQHETSQAKCVALEKQMAERMEQAKVDASQLTELRAQYAKIKEFAKKLKKDCADRVAEKHEVSNNLKEVSKKNNELTAQLTKAVQENME